MPEYPGDTDDPRYDGWSHLGDRYRCPLTDAELNCHHRASRLLAEQRETELRQMVHEGHRCAFVRLMGLLVEAGWVGSLREVALGGDERAGVTLAEYWVRRGDEAALRRETAVLPRTGLWLAGLLRDRGREREAVEVLTALATDAGADERHRQEAWGLLQRRTKRDES